MNGRQAGPRTPNPEKVEAEAPIGDLDVNRCAAYGKHILIERIVKKAGEGLIIPEHLKHKHASTYSFVLSVGHLVDGDIVAGDRIVYLSGGGLGQVGPNGGNLIIVHENNVILVERKDNPARREKTLPAPAAPSGDSAS